MSSMDHPSTSTNGSGASRPTDAADIFSDLSALRLSPEAAGQIGTAEVLVNVPVRKPSPSEFVRVCPDPTMSLATTIYIDAERETYFVAPEVRDVLVAGVKTILLMTAVTQRGLVLLWPIALGDGSSRRNAWHETARDAAELAKREWVKVVSDMTSGCYHVFQAKGKLPEPVFPDKTLPELLRVAFRGRIIDSENHPAVRQALGLMP